jgi:hypothetical protein
MGQIRNRTGTAFEKLLPKGFIRVVKSPKMTWTGVGRSNIQKIKSCGFDVTKFNLLWDKSNFEKYDWIGDDGKKYEVKKYDKCELTKWTLYSEPFFKIATKSNTKKIEPDVYNEFLERFYEYNKQSGLFDSIIQKMISTSNGIYIKNYELIKYSELEFNCELVKGCYAGYNRIMIKFKLKS